MISSFKTGPIDNNVYVLIDEAAQRCVVIDPGVQSDHILEALRRRGLTIAAIVNTHGHWDHVAGIVLFRQEQEIPIYRHVLDEEMAQQAEQSAARWGFRATSSPPATHTLTEGENFRFGPYDFEVRHVPGHSPGSVCFIGHGLAIVGDTLFSGSIGRTDIPNGSLPLLLSGIRDKLLTLPDETQVLPGHGPQTTIGDERRSNPFLKS